MAITSAFIVLLDDISVGLWFCYLVEAKNLPQFAFEPCPSVLHGSRTLSPETALCVLCKKG